MSHLTRCSIALCLLALLSLGPDATAGVSTRVVTEARTGVGAGVTATSSDHKECEGCLASTSNTGIVIGANGVTSHSTGFGTAYAEHGVLKTFASSESSGPRGYAQATSTATFGDLLTIDAPGLSGQNGAVSMLLLFDFLEHVVGQPGAAGGRAQLGLDLFVGGRTERYERTLIFDPNGLTTSQSFDPGNVVVPFGKQIVADVDFVFGQPFTFVATLRAFATGSFDQQVEVDASHSAYWGGFQSVLDVGGNAVDYTVTSSSLTDWSRSFVPSAVPEPPPVALLLAGMGLIGVFTHRRRADARLDRVG